VILIGGVSAEANHALPFYRDKKAAKAKKLNGDYHSRLNLMRYRHIIPAQRLLE